ncbi:PAS domain S-box protein [Kitasatospora sp. NPDC056446]|uniref:PAS domain S-box protein n=1 Tax=Kitasatospora sp. NPDC056446 TaxID=3345819 RepID=UPI00368DC6D2
MLEKPTGRPERRGRDNEPEVEAFVGFLHQLFEALGISLTRLSTRVCRDKGSVSRYLSGERIAPTDFVDALLQQVAELNGNPVTDSVRAQAHQLRLEALRVRNPSHHQLDRLRESLGAAERELHRASVRERVLLRALEAVEEQARQAEQRYRQLETDWAAARYASGSSELDLYAGPDGADELREEILGLKTELEALREELLRARALKHEAEEQCLRLEARLLAAEDALKAERDRAQAQAEAETQAEAAREAERAAAAEEAAAREAAAREAATEAAHSRELVDSETSHRILMDLNAARSLAGTLQAVVEGAVHGLGFDAAAVSLVRPDGDLVVAAVWELEESPMGGPSVLLGQIGSRRSWDRLLGVSDHWGGLRFLPYGRGWAVADDIPSWTGNGPLPVYADDWHPSDALLAPMYSAGGDLLGVLSVDRPRSGKRPDPSAAQALERFAVQASIAIGNARLRAEMQRALARMEKEEQALRASEESFRQAFEYAPSGMAITELHGTGRGLLSRVNDALCNLLGRPRAVLRRQTFADLVHPEDRALLEHANADGGRANVRLVRRGGDYQWVRVRNSIVADAGEGPSFLLTHVEDISDWIQDGAGRPG